MRKTAIFAALLLLPSFVRSAPLNRRVTVQVKDAPLTALLDTISAQGKVNFILTEDFPDKKASLDLRDVSLDAALRAALGPAGLEYRRLGKGNTYLVARKGAPPKGSVEVAQDGPALKRDLSVSVREAPLSDLFATVSAQSRLSFALAPDVGTRKMTVSLKHVTVREFLEVLAETKALKIRQTGKDKFSVEDSPKG